MKSYKRTLFYLFLWVMTFGILINLVGIYDEEWYKSLTVYHKWFLVITGLLVIINEIRTWNKPEESLEARTFPDSIPSSRKILISLVGMAISFTGFLLFTVLDSQLPGVITSSCGLLILYFSIYLFYTK